MMTEQQVTQYRSFLVRLWQEDEPAPATAWRGEIESIQSGQQWRFESLSAMFELFQSFMPRQAHPVARPNKAEGERFPCGSS